MISNGTIASGDAGKIFTVFGSVMQASVALGACLPHFTSLTTALGCGSDVFEVINERPNISQTHDNIDENKIPLFKGDIHFKNVSFSYPQRPDVKVSQYNDHYERLKQTKIIGIGQCELSRSIRYQCGVCRF
jgi:ABC-type multidrug transport system fused ATPase/permease subunit